MAMDKVQNIYDPIIVPNINVESLAGEIHPEEKSFVEKLIEIKDGLEGIKELTTLQQEVFTADIEHSCNNSHLDSDWYLIPSLRAFRHLVENTGIWCYNPDYVKKVLGRFAARVAKYDCEVVEMPSWSGAKFRAKVIRDGNTQRWFWDGKYWRKS